ncbi:MAG: flagellar hook assembly protein FlgD [Zoogloeaceae bacterium]|jgi:flagellar basal-body rod modification protein FlgD|nr:flagellar hook assembly protein FlgD [Zoogloeaceae bacterium]
MSSIDSIVNSLNSAGAVSNTKKSTTEEMSDQFMKLFMAQLQNQDPLNPLENTEMTSQLAQLNMVSGLETLNQSMQTLLSSYNEALSMQAANLIGKNVLAPGDQMFLADVGEAGEGEEAQRLGLFGVELSGPADTVEVIIRDESGNVVSSQNLGQSQAGPLSFVWDGKDKDGNLLPAGNYSFSVSSSLDGVAVLNTPLQAGTVSALTRSSSGFMLEVAGLGNLSLDSVRQVF